MSQATLLDFYSKISDPLPPPCSSSVCAPPSKKRHCSWTLQSAKKPPSIGAAKKEKAGEGTEEVQVAKEDGKS